MDLEYKDSLKEAKIDFKFVAFKTP